jgi:putative Mn2+ efflux pump MntP
MKQLYFIKWCYNNIITNIKSWDRWMWGWFVTCGWGPTAVMDREMLPTSYHLFILFVLIFWVGYGLVYTGIKRAYKKFQEEQERMIEHLKGMQ